MSEDKTKTIEEFEERVMACVFLTREYPKNGIIIPLVGGNFSKELFKQQERWFIPTNKILNITHHLEPSFDGFYLVATVYFRQKNNECRRCEETIKGSEEMYDIEKGLCDNCYNHLEIEFDE